MRSMYDVLSSLDEIIHIHLSYKTTSEEKEFMKNLESENPRKYCLYITMKIFHIFEIKFNISINKMKTEFHYGYFDSLFLMNIFFISVEKYKPDLKKKPKEKL